MGCDWKTCQFILDIILFLGWVGKVSFWCFFSSVSKFEGCRIEKKQQINEQRLVHLKKQSEKNRETWKQHFRIPVNQSRAVSPDDEEIFELGALALANQKESGCVWV